MHPPRRALLLALAAAAGLPFPLRAQPPAAEAALRQWVAAFNEVWNRRDRDGLAGLMADDVEWVFVYAQPKIGKGNVVAHAATWMEQYHVRHSLAKLKLDADGTRAIVIFKGYYLELPVREGRYTRVFARDTLFARMRLEEGRWLMTYMNDKVPESEAMAKAEGL